MPPISHDQSITPSSNDQAALNLPTRYATPCSLPPAFGIEPAHKWSTSTSAGSSYTPSIADRSSGYEFETCSVGSSPSRPVKGYPQPGTPLSTGKWVEQASKLSSPTRPSGAPWSVISSPTRPNKAPPSVSSYLFNKPRTPRKDKRRTSTTTTPLKDCPDPNEHLLQDLDVDVDGPVSSSEDEEEDDILHIDDEIEDKDESKGEGEDDEDDEDEDSLRHPALKYLDIAAQDAGVTKKRKRAFRKNKTNQHRIPESVDSGDDGEYTVKKPAKRAKTTPSPSKKTSKSTKKAPGKKAPLSSQDKKRTSVSTTANPLKKWSGPTQGLIELLPKPYKFDQDATPLWTYSVDGTSRQSPHHRAVGDIHFSPSLALGEDFHYWVQVGTKEGACWELYYPGRQHPIHAGYVLKEVHGKLPPAWVYRNETR